MPSTLWTCLPAVCLGGLLAVPVRAAGRPGGPPAKLFVDFGDGWRTAAGKREVACTVGELWEPFSNGKAGPAHEQAPNLTRVANPASAAGDKFRDADRVRIEPLDAVGGVSEADKGRVLDLVRHIYRPFRVDVERVSPAGLRAAKRLLADAPGHDAYVLVGRFTEAASGRGFNGGAGGWSAVPDVAAKRNTQDDFAYIFADSLKGYGDRFVDELAVSIAHEAAHLFGLPHASGGKAGDPGTARLAESELIMGEFAPVSARSTDSFFLTRFELEASDGYRYSPFDRLAEGVGGLRAGVGEFVTGTGAHDRVELRPVAGGRRLEVTVTPFADPSRADASRIRPPYRYTIPNSPDGVRVELGVGDDELVVYGPPAGLLTVHAGGGTDTLTLAGWGGRTDLWGPADAAAGRGEVWHGGRPGDDLDGLNKLDVLARRVAFTGVERVDWSGPTDRAEAAFQLHRAVPGVAVVLRGGGRDGLWVSEFGGDVNLWGDGGPGGGAVFLGRLKQLTFAGFARFTWNGTNGDDAFGVNGAVPGVAVAAHGWGGKDDLWVNNRPAAALARRGAGVWVVAAPDLPDVSAHGVEAVNVNGVWDPPR